jgi:predicted Zn-dependent protease
MGKKHGHHHGKKKLVDGPATNKQSKRPDGASRHAVMDASVASVDEEELYIKAQIAIMSDNFEQAESYFEALLEKQPNNVEYLDSYGSFLAEFVPEKRQKAIVSLKKACDLSPSAGFEKFMYLGQVLDACGRTREAEAAMRQGVGILRGYSADDQAEFLTSALCSLAELLMGRIHDDEDDMEEEEEDDDFSARQRELIAEVETLLNEALSFCAGKSPEPLQAMSSLRVLQEREEEALSILLESLKLWWNLGKDTDVEEDEDEERGRIPSYEFRFETAKLLLELDSTTETAAEILEELLEENDSVPDVWLLLAVAYRAGGELESAAEAASQGSKIARQHGFSEQDHEVVYALEELEQELKMATKQ